MKERTRQMIGRAIADLFDDDVAVFNYAEAVLDLATNNDQLRAKLVFVEKFLRGVARRPELGVGAKDLRDEADEIKKLLSAGETT
jgi:hypothetical protein